MKVEDKLALDSEIDFHVESFIKSSNLVRYSIIVITVASILLFVGHYNSRTDSWFNSRLKLAYLAMHEKVWLAKEGELSGVKELARLWASSRQYQTEEEIKEHIKTLEDARTHRLLLLEVPFFGVSHDVNDLGIFGSIALSVLMIMLTFSMSRQHENLYLALWRVRRIWDLENRNQSPTSHANLIYHTLAMSQQFSQPPSLARWKTRRFKRLSRVLLLSPLIVQTLSFIHDWNTRELGIIVNERATWTSLFIQAAALVVVFALTSICYMYTRSNELRWISTFECINREFAKLDQPSWLEWVQLIKPKKKYCTTHHPRLETPKDPAPSENDEEPGNTQGPNV